MINLSDVVSSYIKRNSPYSQGMEWKVEEILRQFSSKTIPSIDCQSGWIDLIYKMHESLLLVYPQYNIFQVKEKFGTLRFYIDQYPDLESASCFAVQSIIKNGELLSQYTCEKCGQNHYGVHSRNSYRWIHTYCDKCELEYITLHHNQKFTLTDEEISYKNDLVERLQKWDKQSY